MKFTNLGLLFTVLAIYVPSVAAISLGHITIIDPRMGSRTVTYEKTNGYAVVEGDILLGKTADLSKKNAIILSKISGGRWPHGIVPFEIDEDLPLKNKLAVLQAIDHWQQKTSIVFVELTSKNRNVYNNYIAFVPASGTTCSSYVGRQKDRQEINLATRCTTMNTVHEIGHALGLWHEQSRSDRDLYIRIVWENIEDDHLFNFKQHLSDGEDFGEYDYESIMHYGAYAFSKNGEKTIIPLNQNIEIGQRDHLSEHDIAAIEAMYSER